jgi:prepilin-type N-terminal cleavage/methylation domain-containing protein
MKKGFTLIELLVVIVIIAVLMGIMTPLLSQVKEKAKVTAVDMELRQIGIVLETYFESNQKFPPTQADCISGSLTEHLYQLPKVLVEGYYLPSMPKTDAMSTVMEDRFNRGHTYKYRSVGEIIVDRDRIDKYIWAKLWIPNNFPTNSSLKPEDGRQCPDADECKRYSDTKSSFVRLSPVSWVLFSLGPRFSEEWLEEKIGLENRYPVPKELWYTPKQRRGFIVRMQLKNGSQIGTFESNQ